jgi:hypothetical protein
MSAFFGWVWYWREKQITPCFKGFLKVRPFLYGSDKFRYIRYIFRQSRLLIVDQVIGN